ncbi:glycosyltransferase family 1 protein, partial [Cellulomonas aerilata]|uniref:glycosyltransferase family 1 protein n=2 Tax=Cellulomonas aerilata TaxID=515326 RepID=UPI0011BE472C
MPPHQPSDLSPHLPSTTPPTTAPTTAPTMPDLVVLSHLRWEWVWQRPQHIVSRIARQRAAAGARTWFVEEPVVGDVDHPQIRTQPVDGLTRAWLVMPPASSPTVRSEAHPMDRGFEDAGARDLGPLLAAELERAGRPSAPDVWLYTPMALDVARSLAPGRLIYDVMDDLASFKNPPQGLMLRQRRLLADADVVFTGGPSLHRGITRQRG